MPGEGVRKLGIFGGFCFFGGILGHKGV
jgi:hypothetical protein